MTEMFITIGGLIVTVALLSVFLSKNSNTSGVIQSFFSGFSGALNVATGPITGNTSGTFDYSFPNSTGNMGMSGFGGMNFR
jgi:hypothetical protein